MSANTSATARKNVLTVAQITRAAGVVMFSFVLTGVLGIVRQSIVGSRFGATGPTDAFIAANRVSETLFTLISGGALGSAFIPVFSRFLSKDDTLGAWRLASAIVTLMSITGAILAVLAGLFAQPITARLLLPQAPPEQQLLTAGLMRVMLITVVIFSVSGLSMAILNAHQRFLAASLAPSLYNIGLIIGALALVPRFGVYGLAYGAILGALLHLGVQLPALRTLKGQFRPSLDLTTPGVVEVLRLMGPRVLGLGVIQINFWVNAALTSGMAAGSLTAFTFAFALLFTVLGVLGQSVGTAVFPTLSALSAQHDLDGFRRVLASAMRGVLFMAFPATVGLIVLAVPLVDTLYHHGSWAAPYTEATAWALQFFAVGLAGFALQEVLARAFYALRDTLTPVVIGILGVILNVLLSLILLRIIHGHLVLFGTPLPPFTALSLWIVPVGQGPFGGLALANALATLIESVALWLLMRRRLIGILDREILSAAVRAGLAALIMGVVIYGFAQAARDLPPVLLLSGGTLIGAAVFEGLAAAFGLDEARTIPRALLRRFRR